MGNPGVKWTLRDDVWKVLRDYDESHNEQEWRLEYSSEEGVIVLLSFHHKNSALLFKLTYGGWIDQ